MIPSRFLTQVRNTALPDLASLLALGATALFIGLALNQIDSRHLQIPHQSKEKMLTEAVLSILSPGQPNLSYSSQPTITAAELTALLNANQALLIDARSSLFHQTARIPGALSLPRERFKENYLLLHAQLEAASQKRIVVYCQNVQCEDSQLVASALTQLGLKNVSVLRDGYLAWAAENLPVEKARP